MVKTKYEGFEGHRGGYLSKPLCFHVSVESLAHKTYMVTTNAVVNVCVFSLSREKLSIQENKGKMTLVSV